MQSHEQRQPETPDAGDLAEVHAEFSAVQFDERLLPLLEEHQRQRMAVERQKQEDRTKVPFNLWRIHPPLRAVDKLLAASSR